jgi:ComF family protein
MKTIIKGLLDVLYPPVCHVCEGALAERERFVCRRCLERLPRTGYHRNPDNPMVERFAGQFPFTHATGHFFYSRDSDFASLIHDMKYRHFPAIGNLLGRVAGAELFPTGFFADVDLIVPVPMHFLKQVSRGYNQTDHIAAGVSDATGLPVAKALCAPRHHRTQTALSREQRLANMDNRFAVADHDAIAGQGVLLVDDICTTGATLRAAADTLLTANPRAITLLTLGVTI